MNADSHSLLYRALDRAEAELLQAALDANGIPSLAPGGNFIATHLGIPDLCAHVEIWVPTESLQQAAQVIRECQRRTPAPTATAWNCPACRETIDAGFDICWNCGAAPRDE